MPTRSISTRRALLILIALVIILMAITFWLVQSEQLGNGGSSSNDSATGFDTAGSIPVSPQSLKNAGAMPADATDNCVDEEPLSLTELMQLVIDEGLVDDFKRREEGLVERLSASPESEHLHVAALIEKDFETSLQLMQRALEINPDSAVALWTAANMCTSPLKTAACPLDEWVQRLVKIDGHNSEAWMLAATTSYAAGDTDAALEAMRQAAAAPETRIFWPDILELAERSLAAGGDFSFAERVSMAFGLIRMPDYRQYTKMCREQSAQNAQWAALCLAYGEHAEQQSKTRLGTAMARSIQSIALEEMGDRSGHAEIQARIQEIRAQRWADTKSGKDSWLGFALYSPPLFEAYVKATRAVGEEEAAAYVMNEARRLLDQEPPATNCEKG